MKTKLINTLAIINAVCVISSRSLAAESHLKSQRFTDRNIESAIKPGGDVGSGTEDTKIVYYDGKSLPNGHSKDHGTPTIIQIPKPECLVETECFDKVSECSVAREYAPTKSGLGWTQPGYDYYRGWFAYRGRSVKVCIAYNGKLERINTLDKKLNWTAQFHPDETGEKWAKAACQQIRAQFLAQSVACADNSVAE